MLAGHKLCLMGVLWALSCHCLQFVVVGPRLLTVRVYFSVMSRSLLPVACFFLFFFLARCLAYKVLSDSKFYFQVFFF